MANRFIRDRPHWKGTPVPPVEALGSEHQKAEFLKQLANDIYWREGEIARKVGIKLRDLPRLFEEDPEFREAYEETKAHWKAGLFSIAAERARERGGDQMLKFLLNESREDGNGRGIQYTADEIKELSNEQLEELKCRLLKSC